MKGSETKMIAFMQGSDKHFAIPVYQRSYSWKTENCKCLYDDLKKVALTGRKSHFFGSIVSVHDPDAFNEYLIIDGQQRLTTVSLLLLAMYDLLVQNLVTSSNTNLSKRIYEEYLIDRWREGEARLKLKPVKTDRAAFRQLFESPSKPIPGSNLTLNYSYFYDRIQKEEITVDQLFDAVCRLEIINIVLNPDDNPQLIFESLNSTGVALSEGDKIRNFILMGLPAREQTIYYEKYWSKIEEYTSYDVSAFIRDYLSVKQQAIPAQSKVYFAFKAYVEDTGLSTEPLLQELLAYAGWYRLLLHTGIGHKALDACIQRLNRLETTVTRPFFLEVLRLHASGILTAEEVADIFLTTENYLFRRTICDLPTNALNKIFLSLHREIMRYDGTDQDYVSKFKYAVLSKKERARFPSDTEFIAAFSERQVYLMNSKNKLYILERFENYGTVEDKDIYGHCDDGTYSIEHIMPQHLTPAWVKALGPDYQQIHETWLHRIANLTLTAYNAQYSNSSFAEKRDRHNGFADSGIRLNARIARKERWTLDELEERSQYLMERALVIWGTPVTAFRPKEKQFDSYTLEDDAVLTNRLIARFSYKNIEQPVTSWVEMYQKVLQILYAEDSSVLTKLALSKEDGLPAHFSTDAAYFAKSVPIGDSVYAWTNTSTQSKLSVLSRIFKLYDADPSDLVFYLRDESETRSDEAGTRFELRRRYWTYALEFIHDAHGDGSFSNVTSSKENWINGTFGISGFALCCVANYDSARVELYLGKPHKEENKRVFDALALHRAEIEATLGMPLIWSRSDDSKASKVYCQLDRVSIENETDWLQMAKFHAEWSKKFYDVFVPYLTALQ